MFFNPVSRIIRKIFGIFSPRTWILLLLSPILIFGAMPVVGYYVLQGVVGGHAVQVLIAALFILALIVRSRLAKQAAAKAEAAKVAAEKEKQKSKALASAAF